jgi:DNA-binding transcriptional regulator YhcF (GntR family)
VAPDDPDDTRPLFQRVIDDIRERITAGHLHGGDKLPGANQLATEYGYAHMTIQRALQELKHQGLIYSVKGKGTFVHPKARERLERENLTASDPAGIVTITSHEQYSELSDATFAKVSQAMEAFNQALEEGDQAAIDKADAEAQKAMLEASPALIATTLYFLRYVGAKEDPELPPPGMPTYLWTIYGKSDPTPEEMAEVRRNLDRIETAQQKARQNRAEGKRPTTKTPRARRKPAAGDESGGGQAATS